MELMDPRIPILQRIDLSKSRVQFNKKTVLLCGGRYGGPEIQEDEFLSIRHALYIGQAPNDDFEYLLAETHPEWIHDGIYPNLLEYENNLATLCTRVIVILESASAISEAGVFSQVEELSKKTTLIIPDRHHGSNSYIDLGVVRKIEEDSNKKSHYYPWHEHRHSSITKELAEEIREDLKEVILDDHPRQFYKNSNTGHLIILINQLIIFFQALLIKELESYLKILGLDISEKLLKKHLKLLENLEAIRLVPVGNRIFYTCTNRELFRMIVKNSIRTEDEVRIIEECKHFYENSKEEKKRLQAIKKSMGIQL
ncbi:retron St85 family effector protein [Halioxenophilus aromaticivorans]|uniref:Uncharacterized protein n=1 Tax=Halioxenophilus aromaticivorans TaxID=1306992 RepID=A0AAV3U4U6_9ALTE